MKLKLTVEHGGERRDVLLVADSTATVASVAERLRFRLSGAGAGAAAEGLVVNRGSAGERSAAPTMTLSEAGLRSGDTVALSSAGAAPRTDGPSVGTLNVVAGPDAGQQFPLARGTNLIGRDRTADIRLSDPRVSKRHAKLNVTDAVEIIDDGSANGIVIGGSVVDRALVRPGTSLTLGDSTVTVTLHTTGGASIQEGEVAFNRSPRLDPEYAGVQLKAPEPPKPQGAQRFPIMSLLAPVAMGGMIYAITKNPMSLLFVAMSPVMMLGGWFENRLASKRSNAAALANYRSALLDLSVQLQYASDLERSGRRAEHPSAPEVEAAARDLTELVWTRRPEHDRFLQFRVGLGTQPSRNTVELPTSNATVPELWRELLDVVGQFSTIGGVPVVADLRTVGNVGVAGPDRVARGVAANVIGQLVALHSPAELVLAAVAGENAPAWEWLKWLPHTGSEFSPVAAGHLAANSAEANALVSAIEEVIETRGAADSRGDQPAPLPAVVLFVDDDAPVERARLVQLAERGPAAGVHLVWNAPSVPRLPAACRLFLDIDAEGRHIAGYVQGGVGVSDLEPESIAPEVAGALARRLAPVTDSGVRLDDQSDLPRTVSFLDLTGAELASDPDAVIENWRANNALPSVPGAPKPKRDNTLRAVVGQGAAGVLHLDLRTHGPHALVGGTTGAGKSEFLQSWVLGMAAAHSPSRVTFLFVDYKGGAAFADCIHLPHCVGLVTDLSPHLVRRALTSLNAELRYREHILNGKKAKDLFELEKRNDPDAPPSLVIVVDEFAALVHEVPEFVDGVVNVAQRGRSLGLNLILATQRPAGVIKDNLRANTNLRVALRMADEGDSDDVVGSKVAATFDPGLPGRGVVKTGPGRLATFQSAYVGGHSTGEPPAPSLEIRDLVFGAGELWDAPPEPPRATHDGPNDIKRVVANIAAATQAAAVPTPRKPWLPELAPTYRLDALPSRRTDHELVFGVIDDPQAQSQPEIAFLPDVDGNMAVYGAGGSGKSTFLRSIAVAAAFAPARGGPVHVYGLDFGSRGLAMLEALPHVGSIIDGDDDERVQRLLRHLRATVDERSERYETVKAGDIVEYRRLAGRPDEARIVVLVDGVGAFRTAYEASSLNRYWDMFQSLAADGRRAGVHFVVSADRSGAVSTSLASAIQRRLVLRLANEMDYTMLDTPADALDQTSPPGRGFVDGVEVQVAVLGGETNMALQADEIARLIEAMKRAGVGVAPPIESLPEAVPLSGLPDLADGLPTLGIWDETLQPIGFVPSGAFLVSGPPLSGKTTTVATIATSLQRACPRLKLVLFGARRSALVGVVPWACSALGPADIVTLASDLATEITEAEPGTFAVFVESIGELLNTEADFPLQELLKACRASEQFVVAEGETSSVTGSWPLLQTVKVSRAGIALQPDQMDGDSLFKTSFPRVNRGDFPFGRGLLVVAGKHYRVQVALPE
ncbi:MAG TPA: FtsK/SpoIIIE domain-containing protein [Ilumatobacter sp.]|nr:FtsK/SpoIIIE domain-containing protein [Ilumatobacter sp.]